MPTSDSIGLNVTHASGDGDSPLRCCRLCGGNGNLRCFCETYLWEGVEERYDQLLFNCFGIRPLPADDLICERCVCQLRNTQRFRALVQSAFARPPSEDSTNQSQMRIGEGHTQKKIKSKLKLSRLELAKKNTRTGIDLTLRKKKSERKKSIFNTNVEPRRMNIACTLCQQKYPMIMPFNGCKNFVCSRCKKKGEIRPNLRKYNVNLPTNLLKNNLELHAKTDLRGKSRLFSVQKIPSQSVKIPVPTKYQCDQCPKRYSMAQNLSQHINTVHKNTYGTFCTICEKDFNTKELLDRHMRMHTGQLIYRCDVCMRVFKGKRAFQAHYLTHGK
ncbi:zinc finger protein 891-like isoform X2 [Maniola jurtina]|uniref:zinc finger protein 891-like isoform X2 n=1 Tax=Maniola jurtina TaxID=191418 RepID=UPI001E68ED02|nr:zinc finger protein 891-like isoform X2 [Maniola jurtina]